MPAGWLKISACSSRCFAAGLGLLIICRVLWHPVSAVLRIFRLIIFTEYEQDNQ